MAMNERPQRADAKRNRARILSAASEVIADDGPTASLEKIGRRAQVGAGTLYRHFPTREDLLIAVFTRRIESLCAKAQAAADARPPGDALTHWLHALLAHCLSDRGLADALVALDAKPDIECSTRITSAATQLLEGAQQAGQVRRDATPDDVLRLVIGVALATDDRKQAARILELAVDGLRPR
jgi:AcrR family transcriptional regulator